jgi:hypothetical protein
MKIMLLSGLLLGGFGAQAQGVKVVRLEATSKHRGQLLNSLFPIADIVSIKVTNNSGTYLLTTKELRLLKEKLQEARFAGGLLIKPGHILLAIKLAGHTAARPGFVYGSTGAIHFDGGVDELGQRFSGTFNLPTKLNFDNYR